MRGDIAMKSSITALMLSLLVAVTAFAGDLKEDLLAMEKTAWTAWGSRNGAGMRELVTEDAVQAVAGAGVTTGRDKIVAGINANTCVVKGFDFTDARIRQLSPDIAILTYTATQDSTCDGQKLPPKVFVTSVYVRSDGKWRSTSYQETPL
jgi:uncharacterized protein (TIGR02246 family)